MYYEERVIQGFLHWRDTPEGDWQPFTKAMLQQRIDEVQDRASESQSRLQALGEQYEELRRMQDR